MRTFLAATDVTIVVPFRLNGEPFIPDTNSAKWALRNNAGTEVITNQTITLGAASTEAVVTVAAVNNALGAGRFSKRTLVVTCTKNSSPVRFNVPYRLVGFLNTTVTINDVRNFIGVGPRELPDDMIDVISAYFDVEDEVTEPVLTAALSASDRDERLANNAILARTVINLMPALPLLLAQRETDGVFEAERPRINLRDLEERARQMYAEALDLVSSRLSVDPTLLYVVPTTDPITGV